MKVDLVSRFWSKLKITTVVIIITQLSSTGSFADDVQRSREEGKLIVTKPPLAIWTTLENGMMLDGEDLEQDRPPIEDLYGYMTRTGVWLVQSAAINDPVGMSGGADITSGIGGMFFNTFPEKTGSPWTLGHKFVPAVFFAFGRYKFGDVNNPDAFIKLGYFPYKYNKDARNMGEYLHRSVSYPGLLFTGNWNVINDAQYWAQGMHINIIQGDEKRLKHDFTLFMQRDYFPQFDLSPGYEVSMDWDFIQIGGGIVFNNLITAKPSRSTVKNHPLNTYVELSGFDSIPAIQDTTIEEGVQVIKTLQYAKSPGSQKGLEAEFMDLRNVDGDKPYEEMMYTDTLSSTAMITQDDPLYLADPDAYTESDVHRYPRTKSYFTTKSIKVMGRIAFDFKEFLPSPHFTTHDMRLYIEAAVLGVEDQPRYYEDIMDRIPVMFGFNVPTWEFLDVLAFQWEYWGSKFPNNAENLLENSIPVPTIENQAVWETYNEDDYKRDDWKWSVYGKKHLFKGIDFFFQFGVDHFRFLQENNRHSYASISQESTPIWEFKPAYFMTRFEFGI